jgi:NAD(P)H-hydrate epimerase
MLYNFQATSAKDFIYDLINKASCIIIGPGLKVDSFWSEQIFNCLFDYLSQNNFSDSNIKTIIIDAGGLALFKNYINKNNKSFNHLKFILTPHPGEAKYLLNNTYDINQNRFEAVKLISEQVIADTNSNVTVVLKGNGSLIASNKTSKIAVCNLGNPGMATAGMGDILTGVIAGLLAQNQNNLNNNLLTSLAVYLHAKAGDLAAIVGERGIVATDLLPKLQKLINT